MSTELDLLNEVYRNEVGVVYQCDETSTIWIDFQGKMTPLKYFSFLALKRKVDHIDVVSMFNDTGKGGDLEIINARGCERCFVVTLKELIGLKDLLEGSRVMLDLNSIIHERLFNVLI
ncbi:MAG: hypothetical protein RJQ09_08215 [Cyclobacteriaceae bacterium]